MEDKIKSLLEANFDIVQKVYNSVFKGQVKIDDEMFLLSDDISITPYVDYQDDILGNEHEVVKWIVEKAVTVYGGYWDPPEVDLIDLGEFTSSGMAAVRAVEVLAREQAEIRLEYLQELAWFEEEEKYRNMVDLRDYE